MLNFEEWLLKKQKMGINWFLTMIPDKQAYYNEYDKYKCRAARFQAEMEKHECEIVAKELVALGN